MLFVDEFLRDPRKLWAMREAAAALGRPRASDRAAQEILQLLSTKSAVAAA
jgi:UDP-N-acetylglucosamine:LPS N-acetylglucosamine transferase